jgi:hypothetical protein
MATDIPSVTSLCLSDAVSERTHETTVTFQHPFMLSAFERPQPEGTYRLIVEEVEIPGLSFLAYRRSTTTLCLPALGVVGHTHEMHQVDAAELAQALEADRLL